jgi:phage terminase small subunit
MARKRGPVLTSCMGKVVPFTPLAGSAPRLPRPPDHFKPEECQAWGDIVGSMAPLHAMEEADRWFLELAATELATFRMYAAYVDDLTRARQASVLHDILEHALVPEQAIKHLLRPA